MWWEKPTFHYNELIRKQYWSWWKSSIGWLSESEFELDRIEPRRFVVFNPCYYCMIESRVGMMWHWEWRIETPLWRFGGEFNTCNLDACRVRMIVIFTQRLLNNVFFELFLFHWQWIYWWRNKVHLWVSQNQFLSDIFGFIPKMQIYTLFVL